MTARKSLFFEGMARAEESPAGWLSRIGEHLHRDILPFWRQHAVDPQGGLNTCLADDGRILSRDKFLWSQWRAVWVFARLFNRHGRKTADLELALHIAEFAAQHGWDNPARAWRLILDAAGREVEGCRSIYTDGFAMYALGELFLATGDDRWRALAVRTADAVMEKLAQPHDRIPHAPYPVPSGARVHGLPMMFSLNFAELGRILGAERYVNFARQQADEIFRLFLRPETGLIHERVAEDGRLYPGLAGSAVNPGHVIEDMWFQIAIAPVIGREERIPLACELTRRHLEFGWDKNFGGGILLARDAFGAAQTGWDFADMKLWWPHTEALYALLLCHFHTGDRWFLQWHRVIWEHCMKFYRDTEHGEWRQKLQRDQTPHHERVVFPVKDPFHLPRSLILQIELLQKQPEQAAQRLRPTTGRLQPAKPSTHE